MKSFYFYGHGGSHNHGCEALLKSVSDMILNKYPDSRLMVSTLDGEADKTYFGNRFEIIEDKINQTVAARYFFAALHKYLHLDQAEPFFRFRNFKKSLKKIDKDTCFVSIGGDNYCCSKPSWLYYLNSVIDRTGCKRILIGSNIENKWLGEEMIRDLDGYQVITVRDKLSYNYLKDKLKKAKVYYMPDTAFSIQPEKSNYTVAPNTIGINISPFATKHGRSTVLKKMYVDWIKYLLENTDYNILFIPHVEIPGNDDRATMLEIYDHFKDNHKVHILEKEYPYAQLRDIISQLSALICARTHASISGYSTGVPTLVLGYSEKSHQIAHELFGTDQNYVVDADENTGIEQLISATNHLLANLDERKKILQEYIPTYTKRIFLPDEI